MANFEDIAEFWIEKYPPDIFKEGKNPVQVSIFKIRDEMENLLKILRKWRD